MPKPAKTELLEVKTKWIPTRLVEVEPFSCPHCRKFTTERDLMAMLPEGREISREVRCFYCNKRYMLLMEEYDGELPDYLSGPAHKRA